MTAAPLDLAELRGLVMEHELASERAGDATKRNAPDAEWAPAVEDENTKREAVLASIAALLSLVDERTKERDDARATAAKLNRRAQEAEGALLKPGCPDPRARTLGRALANWAAGLWVRKWEAAAQVIREAMPETMGGYPDLFMPAGGWEAWEARAKKAITRPEDEAREARALSASAPATGAEAKKEEHHG